MPNHEASALLSKLGKQIAAVRRAQGLSAERLSERMGFSVGYLRRVETGRQNLTIRSIVKFADALGVTFWDLVSSQSDPVDPQE